jgi:hypothetical protein
MSKPSSAAGTSPTALAIRRPPTQSCIGKRASHPFSAYLSSSLPTPVTATACSEIQTRLLITGGGFHPIARLFRPGFRNYYR